MPCINNSLRSHLWAIVAFHEAELWPSGCCCRSPPRSRTHKPTRAVQSWRRALCGWHQRKWAYCRNVTFNILTEENHLLATLKKKKKTSNNTRSSELLLRRVRVWFDMLLVFSIHNEVLQNARSLHILLSSPTTCINKSAVAKWFQEKGSSRAACQNEVS